MTRGNFGLLILLALVVVIGLHLQRRAEDMCAWAIEIPEQIPDQDPRRAAAALATQITSKRSQIHHQLSAITRLIDVPVIEPTAVEGPSTGQTSTAPKKSPKEVDQRVKQLFSQAIGIDEAAELEALVDPQRHQLPSRVLLSRDAHYAWLPVRAKWKQPIGQRELSLVSWLGSPAELIDQLDPRIPLHVNHVTAALHGQKVEAAAALRFLKKIPPPEFDRTKLPTYRGIVNLSKTDIVKNEQKVQAYYGAWNQAKPREQYLDLATLSLISHLNSPRLWTQLALSAGVQRTPRPVLDQLQAHAIWHQARIDDASQQVLDRLRSNAAFPDTSFVVDPNAAVDSDRELDLAALQEDALETITDWQQQLLSGTPKEQHELYLRLLKIEPDDRLRPQMLAFAASFKPANAATESLADALYCRWANKQDVTQLFRHATTTGRQRSSPDEPDATAEAILTICRQQSANASEVARFWLGQPRWPRSVSTAWSAGGEIAELAFCEALLGIDLSNPPAGVQQALQTLAGVGDTATLTVLDAIQRQAAAEKLTAPNFDRFIRFCRTRINDRRSRLQHAQE